VLLSFIHPFNSSPRSKVSLFEQIAKLINPSTLGASNKKFRNFWKKGIPRNTQLAIQINTCITKVYSMTSKAMSIRLPTQLVKEIEKLAQAMERPKTYLIRNAIELYLGEYADYQFALDRLQDKGDEILSPAGLREELEIQD
jgi:predicted DNA-binding protein